MTGKLKTPQADHLLQSQLIAARHLMRQSWPNVRALEDSKGEYSSQVDCSGILDFCLHLSLAGD